jgi:hypothetical protein
MRLVVAGRLNKPVGGELGISEITVKASHALRIDVDIDYSDSSLEVSVRDNGRGMAMSGRALKSDSVCCGPSAPRSVRRRQTAGGSPTRSRKRRHK